MIIRNDNSQWAPRVDTGNYQAWVELGVIVDGSTVSWLTLRRTIADADAAVAGSW